MVEAAEDEILLRAVEPSQKTYKTLLKLLRKLFDNSYGVKVSEFINSFF